MPRAKRTTPTLTRLLTVVFHRRAEEPVLHAVDTGRVRLGVSLGSLPVVAEVQERVPNGSELGAVSRGIHVLVCTPGRRKHHPVSVTGVLQKGQQPNPALVREFPRLLLRPRLDLPVEGPLETRAHPTRTRNKDTTRLPTSNHPPY